MPAPTPNEILSEHLPYRLVALDGLVAALLAREPSIVGCEGNVDVTLVTAKVNGRIVVLEYDNLYNSMVDSGFGHARSLLEFLGVKKKYKVESQSYELINSPRTQRNSTDVMYSDIPKASGLDVAHIRRLSPVLDQVEIDRAYTLEEILVKVITITDKAVAHFAHGHGGAWIGHVVFAAAFIEIAVEMLVYSRAGRPVPSYRWWSNTILPDHVRHAYEQVLGTLRQTVLGVLPEWQGMEPLALSSGTESS